MQTCPHCQFPDVPDGSLFCPNCGKKIGPAHAPASKTTGPSMQVKQEVGRMEGDAKAVGAEIERVDGSLTVVNGNVIQVHNPSPEFLKRLEAFNNIPVEMQPDKGQGAASAGIDQHLGTIGASMQAVLNQVRQAETQGHKVEHLEVGGVQVTRVELLVKQAVLFESEAEQMMIDQIGKQTGGGALGNAQAGGQVQVDMSNYLQGFDWQAYQDKLKQAYDLLVEANAMEPTNADVLLHQARLAGDLERDQEAGRLLYKVMKLVENPKNEQEKFWLAQALYLSAAQKDAPHEGMLRQARQLFEQIGRTSWVEQCDLMLRTIANQVGANFQGGGQAVNQAGPQPAMPAPGMTPIGMPAGAPAFNPIGQWQVRGVNGVAIQIRYDPNGACAGMMQPGPMGGLSQFQGVWAFNPMQMVLQSQGWIDGTWPFNTAVQIVGFQQGVYVTRGADGLLYYYARVA
jgi:hypothetical protein